MLSISVAALYVAIFCLFLMIAALILPFTQVGQYEAKKEITVNFSDMPIGDGEVGERRRASARDCVRAPILCVLGQWTRDLGAGLDAHMG